MDVNLPLIFQILLSLSNKQHLCRAGEKRSTSDFYVIRLPVHRNCIFHKNFDKGNLHCLLKK